MGAEVSAARPVFYFGGRGGGGSIPEAVLTAVRAREKADAAAQLSAARAQAALQPWGPYPVRPGIRRTPARREMAGKLRGV